MPRREAPRQHLSISLNVKLGGEGGIRTLDTLSDIQSFQDCALDHYATSPRPPHTQGFHFKNLECGGGGKSQDQTSKFKKNSRIKQQNTLGILAFYFL